MRPKDSARLERWPASCRKGKPAHWSHLHIVQFSLELARLGFRGQGNSRRSGCLRRLGWLAKCALRRPLSVQSTAVAAAAAPSPPPSLPVWARRRQSPHWRPVLGGARLAKWRALNEACAEQMDHGAPVTPFLNGRPPAERRPSVASRNGKSLGSLKKRERDSAAVRPSGSGSGEFVSAERPFACQWR